MENSDYIRSVVNPPLVEKEYDQVGTSPSTAIIEAIASVEDVDPIDLSTPAGITLHNHVDTDALDRILSDGDAEGVAITFPVNEYRVWIERNGVAIADRENHLAVTSDADR